MVDLVAFKRSLKAGAPPDGMTVELRALWHAATGGWDEAHRLIQNESSGDAAWVHAHLHRIEGDLNNAGYWYRRAGRPKSEQALPAEWDEIAGALLGGAAPRG
jgi:hypothetical protein